MSFPAAVAFAILSILTQARLPLLEDIRNNQALRHVKPNTPDRPMTAAPNPVLFNIGPVLMQRRRAITVEDAESSADDWGLDDDAWRENNG